jgi:putative hydrolase of the HAD superfamily
MIRYLLFDLDSTLYSCRFGLEDNVRKRIGKFGGEYLGITEEEFWLQRNTNREKYGTALEWLMSEKNFKDTEAYMAAVHPPDEADSLPQDPQLRAFIESLPLPKAILTNAPMEHADLILGKLGLPRDLFTHIFDVRQFNFRGKPHADVFNKVLHTLGMSAGEVLFIDDFPSYAEGFIAVGGKALLLDENNAYNNYPYPKIRELKELVEYL